MKDLTQGSVVKQLLGMAAFMLVGMGVQTLYSLIDLYWVGALGPKAVAAVTVATTVMFVSLALSQMLGVGTGALVAQSIGARNLPGANAVFNQAMAMALLQTVLFTIIGLIVRADYAVAFSADAETAAQVVGYLTWFIPAMALQFPLMVMGSALRGSGNLKPGTLVQIGTVVLNLVFAPLLIFGWLGFPRLGVAGAGLATLVAIAFGVIALSAYLRREGPALALHPGRWLTPDRVLWGRLFKIGLPSAVEFALMGAYMVFITKVLSRYGATEQAAFGIGQRLLQASMLPVMALSFSAAAVAGQNYGAGLGGRVIETYRATLRFGLICAVICVLIAQINPSGLVSAFTDAPEVIAEGGRFLRIISLNLLAVSFAFACFGVLSGLGNTVPTLISSATRFAFIVISTLVLLHFDRFEVTRLWWLSVGGTVIQMMMNLVFLRRELTIKLGAPANALIPGR